MAEAPKKKMTRTVKPVYAIMSVEDNDGNTMALTKENVRIHAIMKNADDVLAALDAGDLPAGTFYKRISLA